MIGEVFRMSQISTHHPAWRSGSVWTMVRNRKFDPVQVGVTVWTTAMYPEVVATGISAEIWSLAHAVTAIAV